MTEWQMKFNVAKCHSMRVTRHLPSNQYTLTTHCINKHWNRFSPPNTLELLLLTTWNGVDMFLKIPLKQLRLCVFFGAVWHLHLGIRKKLHAKHWFALSSSMQLLFDIPISAGDGIILVASMTCLMNLIGHPWRIACY